MEYFGRIFYIEVHMYNICYNIFYDKCGDYYYSLYRFTSLCFDKSFI